MKKGHGCKGGKHGVKMPADRYTKKTKMITGKGKKTPSAR